MFSKSSVMPLIVAFSLVSCKKMERVPVPSTPSSLSPPPPTIKLIVNSDEEILHVAALVDSVPNYIPLVIDRNHVGLSCDQDPEKAEHLVEILDHRSIPAPKIETVSGGSATNAETGTVTSGDTQFYNEESIRVGIQSIPRLQKILTFPVNSKCVETTLTLTYKSLADGTLQVTQTIDER